MVWAEKGEQPADKLVSSCHVTLHSVFCVQPQSFELTEANCGIVLDCLLKMYTYIALK